MSRLVWPVMPARGLISHLGLAARTSHCVPRRAFLSPLPIGISSPRCHSPSFASLCTKGSNFSTRLQATRHLATSVKPKEPPPAPQERRPLAASPYDSEFSPRSSSERSEELLNLPNILTASRIASTPFLGYLIITDRLAAAVGLLFAAAVTDLLDGWLARKWNKFTVFGSIADPAADKLLMTVMVVTLGYRGFLPPSLASLIILRDVGLVGLAFVIRYRTLPAPVTWSRYWNPRLPSAQVEPTQISKYNTFLQLLSVGGALLLAALLQHGQEGDKDAEVVDKPSSPKDQATSTSDWASRAAHYLEWPLKALWVATAATTIISGWGYFVTGAGYKDLAKSKGPGMFKRMAERTRQTIAHRRNGRGHDSGAGGTTGRPPRHS